MTKCAVRYGAFLNSIHAEQSSAETIEESKQLLENELSLYKVEFHKLALRVETYRKELQQLEQESQRMTTKIEEKKKQVQRLREELKQSRKVFGYKEEYEALAKMANHRPSRAILEKRLLLSQKQMQVCEQNQASLEAELDMRQKQFQTLMQCMFDLKASVETDASTKNATSGDNARDGMEEEEDDAEEGVVPVDTSTTL